MFDSNMTRRQLLMAASGAGALLLSACGGSASSAPGAADATSTADAASSSSAASAETTAPTNSDPASVSSSTSQSTGQGSTASGAAAKALVAFFSRADENYPSEWLEVGHTKVMAGYVAEAVGADLYEIEPVEVYPESYDGCCDKALEEQRENARPAISEALPDVSGYDVVFVGCPIWWGDEPMIVRTFIEGVDLSGKTVVPFTTHAGSGLGNVPANLQAAIPGASFLDGLAVMGTSVDGARDEVVDWAKACMQA